MIELNTPKLAIIFLLAVMLISPLQSYASTGRKAFIRVPAVYQSANGVSMGALGNLTVEVESGSGEVYFSADPLTQIDTQGAARTAALVASYILGKDPLSYNFYYRLESNSMMIGGPSAGAAMTAATMAAILGMNIRKGILITGMINPDGTIGPVGGIPEKLEAVAKGGAKIFLIPAGQRIVERTIPKEEKIGPLIITTVEKKKVDLIDLGKKLGVKVVEVATISDAVKYLIGLKLKAPSSAEPKIPSKVKSILIKWVNHYLNESESIRSNVKSNLTKLSYLAKRVVKSVLNNSEDLYKQAKDEMNQGEYYTSSSSAFQSTYEAEYAKGLLEYAIEGPKAVDSMVSRVNSKVNTIGSKLNATRPNSFSSLEALIAAKTRYYMARDALNKGAQLASKQVYPDSSGWGAIHWLAYAYWRAETAETWTWLFGLSKGQGVPEARVRKVASVLLYESESVTSYALSLLQDIGASSSLLNEASNDLNDAEAAYSSGDIYGSLGLATSSLAKATASIHQWFSSDPINAEKAIKSISYSSINNLLSKGIVPVLALSYAETGKIFEQKNGTFSSIVYYELSSAHAHMLLLISKVKSSVKTKTVTSTSMPQGQPSATPSETPKATPTSQPIEGRKISTEALIFIVGALIIGLTAGYLLGRR